MGISVCMIGKNEAWNLAEALSCAKTFADEIIYVDTGSSDDSIEVAEKHGAYAVLRKWRDDFSDARNLSLRLANQQWIMWMDCDDRITPENAEKIRVISRSVANQALVFKVRNVNVCNESLIPDATFSQMRMWPNFRGIEFKGKIHEVVGESVFHARIPTEAIDIEIEHHGYSDASLLDSKIRRNHKIALMERIIGHNNVSFVDFKVDGLYCYFAPWMIYVWDKWKLLRQIPAISVIGGNPFDIMGSLERMVKAEMQSYTMVVRNAADIGLRISNALQNGFPNTSHTTNTTPVHTEKEAEYATA